MHSRKHFPVAVSGGTAYSNSAQAVSGEIAQLRWVHAADTGQVATIQVSVLPDEDDTGLGWDIYSRASANIATQFTAAPRQPMHGVDGNPDPADTGSQFGVPILLHGDRLRVLVVPVDTGVVIDGDLYVWVKN